MKKTYLNPTTKVVQIHHTQMLCACPYDNKMAPLETYDEDEDVIEQMGYIW